MKIFINVLLKKFLTFTLSLYFKQWIVEGIDKIPKRQPVIFASNHQNAFLDALVITCSSNRLPYYLARAEVFGSSIARSLLAFIRIMPIYRFRDGLGNVKKNDAILETCMGLLLKNKSLVMFPEGNHSDLWTIRTLQRGLSRIALPAESMKDWELGLKIVPIGIQYEDPKSFRGRILVTFGDPIEVQRYKEQYIENNRKGLDVLKSDVEVALKELVVHIPEEDYELHHSHLLRTRPYLKNYKQQVEIDKRILKSHQTGENIEVPQGDKKPGINPIAHLFGVWTFINNYIPFLLTQSFIQSKIKDPVFVGSIKLTCGVVFAPIFHLIVGITLSIVFQLWWIGIIYIISQPIAGYLGGFDAIKSWGIKTKKTAKI